MARGCSAGGISKAVGHESLTAAHKGLLSMPGSSFPPFSISGASFFVGGSLIPNGSYLDLETGLCWWF